MTNHPAEQIMPELARKSGTARRYAARMLGIESDQAVIPYLVSALRSDESPMRETAARVLGELRDPSALAGLTDALRNGDPALRAAAARSLRRFEHPEVIAPLANALGDPHAQVRIAAAAALWPLAEKPRYSPDRDNGLRTGMLRELSQATPGLVKALGDPEPDVRANAAKALGRFESGAEAALKEALPDSAPEVRTEAALALGRLKSPAAVGPLTELMEGPDKRLCYSAVETLRGMQNPGNIHLTVPAFITALRNTPRWGVEDPGRSIREAAAEALGEAGDPRGVPALIEALDEWDKNVRHAVAAALGTIGDPRAVPGLLGALRSRDYAAGASRSIAHALLDIGTGPALEGIMDALEENRLDFSRRIAVRLGESGHVPAMPRLRAMLEEGQEEETAYAAQALGLLGDTLTGPEPLEELSNGRPRKRERAALVLRHLVGPETAVPALIAALQDEDFGVRATAARSLGQTEDPQAVEPLIQALQDDGPGVRGAAAAALNELGDQRAVGPLTALIEAMRDKPESERRTVELALKKLTEAPAQA